MPYDSNGNWVSDPTQEESQGFISDSDRVLASIPIIGGLAGSQGRIDAGNNARASAANRRYWDTLDTPSADELTAQYDYPSEGRDAQMSALGQLGEWSRGGLTGADRGALESTRRRDEQGSRAQRGALMQQAQARGVGGSGLDFATQMQANQAGQAQASDAESQMMLGAQQRALAATQAQGSLGTAMRGQGEHETEQQADARVQGRQQAYEDQASRAAGATGQYSTDTNARAGALGRAAQERDQSEGAIGSIIAALASA